MSLRVQDFGGGVTADAVETAKEPELEAKPEAVTEQLQSHDKVLTNEV